MARASGKETSYHPILKGWKTVLTASIILALSLLRPLESRRPDDGDRIAFLEEWSLSAFDVLKEKGTAAIQGEKRARPPADLFFPGVLWSGDKERRWLAVGFEEEMKALLRSIPELRITSGEDILERVPAFPGEKPGKDSPLDLLITLAQSCEAERVLLVKLSEDIVFRSDVIIVDTFLGKPLGIVERASRLKKPEDFITLAESTVRSVAGFVLPGCTAGDFPPSRLPRDWEFLETLYRGLLLYDEGRGKEALALLQKAATAEPLSYPPARFTELAYAAVVGGRAGDGGGSISAYRRAIEGIAGRGDSKSTLPFVLGNMYEKLGRKEDALRSFLKALEADDERGAPDKGSVYLKLALLEKELGQDEKAHRHLKKGAAASPHNVRIQAELVRSSLRSGDPLGTITALERLSDIATGTEREKSLEHLRNLTGFRWKRGFEKEIAGFFILGRHIIVSEEGRGLTALHVKTGLPDWDLILPAAGSVAGAGNSLFIPTTDGRVVSVNASEGNVNWEFPIGEKGDASFSVIYLTAGMLILLDAKNGRVVSLNLSGDRENWRRDLESPLAPGLVFDSEKIYLSSRDGRLLSLSKKTGEKVFERRTALTNPPPFLLPVISGDSLVFPCSLSTLCLYDTGGGLVKSGIGIDEPLESLHPTSRGVMGFSAGDKLYAVDIFDEEIKYRIERASSDHCLCLSLGDLVIFSGEDGLNAIEAASGNPVWLYPAPNRDFSGIKAWKDCFFASSGTLLYLFDLDRIRKASRLPLYTRNLSSTGPVYSESFSTRSR